MAVLVRRSNYVADWICFIFFDACIRSPNQDMVQTNGLVHRSWTGNRGQSCSPRRPKQRFVARISTRCFAYILPQVTCTIVKLSHHGDYGMLSRTMTCGRWVNPVWRRIVAKLESDLCIRLDLLHSTKSSRHLSDFNTTKPWLQHSMFT